MSNTKLEAARVALKRALLDGGDVSKARAEVRKLEEAAAKAESVASDREAEARAAAAASAAIIVEDAERLEEARQARIAACVARYAVKAP